MKLTLNDLTVNPAGMDRDTLLSSWQWAITQKMNPVLLTAMGDVFLQSDTGSVHFINSQAGFIDDVADSGDAFSELLQNPEFVNDYFAPKDIGILRQEGL